MRTVIKGRLVDEHGKGGISASCPHRKRGRGACGGCFARFRLAVWFIARARRGGKKHARQVEAEAKADLARSKAVRP